MTTFVCRGVFAENILEQKSIIAIREQEMESNLHHDDCFLHDVANSGGDKFQEDVDTSLCGNFNLDSTLPNGFDAPSDKIDVDFGRVPDRFR